MKPKVSIIVPIYNVDKYLNRCLDSILNQSLKEIEIIAVNDGSTDRSYEILLDYQKSDPRLKVINKKNGGVSSARNTGLEQVTGEYIGFVDPDDWIDKHMYEELYKTAQVEEADVVMCSYIREFGSHSKKKQFHMPEQVKFTGEEVHKKILRRLIGPLGDEVRNPELLDAWGTVWSKLYKTNLILDNKIVFTDLHEIGTNEDSLFNIEVMYFTQNFVFINKYLYHYWRENSTSLTSNYKPNLLSQWECLFKKLSTFIEEKELGNDYSQALSNRICLNTLGLGLNELFEQNQQASVKVKKIKKILHHQQIKSSFTNLDLSQFPLVWRVFYFFAKSRFVAGYYCLLVTINILRKSLR
ncbi:glycosyltransferase family 2 protein [Robertmurraya sp. FSL R5-0851]|uniref:glycosyltransferase family 2 protein n=1 Tax=Robertmurraya sp. FSL R5-0851 TaxID=2921584 RepID=UPI0030FC4315